MSTLSQSGNQSVLSLACTLAVFFGMTLKTSVSQAQSESYPSFRVLSTANPVISSPDSHSESPASSVTGQAVWLAGTIKQTGGGWSRELEEAGYLGAIAVSPADQEELREQIHLGPEEIATRSSYDTTQLAALQDDSSTLGRALNDAEQELADRSIESPKEHNLNYESTSWISWKSTSLSGSWLPGSGNQLGTTTANLSGTIVFPNFQLAAITPAYQMYFLNGPNQTDVPSTLHYASVSFTGYIPFSDRWIGQISVAPGIASDFQTGSSRQMRTTGVGMMIFQQSKSLQWTFGISYLDREDVALLPIAGLSWSPDERTRIEFLFPRPRLKRQLSKSGDYEKWAYFGAEFGGGSWAINRSSGTDDVVVLREYRLLAGIEHKLPESRSWFWETGLVLGRSVEYSSGIGNYNPATAVVLSGGFTY